MAPKSLWVHFNVILYCTKIIYLGGHHWHSDHAVVTEILPFGSKHEVEENHRELGGLINILCSLLGRREQNTLSKINLSKCA
jgi:hypothetical protein